MGRNAGPIRSNEDSNGDSIEVSIEDSNEEEVFPMRIFRPARVMLLALLVCLIPASSNAGVFIRVGFAPPVLPVYVQPPCPEDGWLWTPGYWAYGDDGYYWVPGTWVPAPYVGALWTPGYWGWGSGRRPAGNRGPLIQ
jgi:hypothetical protein